jgi:hypothetical protein
MALLANRNNAPLDANAQRRTVNTFLGLDNTANVRYEDGAITRFRVTRENDEDTPEIIIGPDIYPGPNVADPNASLCMEAAAAHEVVHFHRWQAKTELPHGFLTDIDEALTSLEAVLRFPRQLRDHEVRPRVADAIHRLQKFAQEHAGMAVQANNAAAAAEALGEIQGAAG